MQQKDAKMNRLITVQSERVFHWIRLKTFHNKLIKLTSLGEQYNKE